MDLHFAGYFSPHAIEQAILLAKNANRTQQGGDDDEDDDNDDDSDGT